VNVGDYWNDETLEKIMDLLSEYYNMFPTKFLEMKGIDGEKGGRRLPSSHMPSQ
jgi:hypothetical protein